LLLLVSLELFLLFWGLGDLPFYTRGEPREGLVVWEMYKSGNWILPAINGDYIPFKPPLFHWFGVLAALVAGGVDEFVARFPSALFGTLGVLFTYGFAARWWNRRAAVMAGVVLATSFEWWQAGTITQVDMTLAFFHFRRADAFLLRLSGGALPQSSIVLDRFAVGFSHIGERAAGSRPSNICRILFSLYPA
jgi:4-amino-4-deoxy-L-arabinose transferase-like glycosyltransferase